jgi:predicted nucleotide-binding protein
MAKNSDPPSTSRANLTVSREDAATRIIAQIDSARTFQNASYDKGALQLARDRHRKWRRYTTEMLKAIFDQPSIAEREFAASGGIFAMHPTLEQQNIEFQREIQRQISDLESILERLEFFQHEQGHAKSRVATSSNRVFVVHGHDSATKESVARMLGNLGLEPIILHEQTNGGRTVIEKFEQHSDVAFAVVLLTADDEGGAKGGTPAPRARQNVILELGYFVGKLGRERVCPLYQKGVELPSDLAGLVYTELDLGGAWQFKLAREMKSVGLDVDLNKL